MAKKIATKKIVAKKKVIGDPVALAVVIDKMNPDQGTPYTPGDVIDVTVFIRGCSDTIYCILTDEANDTVYSKSQAAVSGTYLYTFNVDTTGGSGTLILQIYFNTAGSGQISSVNTLEEDSGD